LSRRDLLRGVAGIGAAAGGSALLSGCAGSRKPGTLLYGFYGNQQEIDIYQRVADLYRKRNPHVKMSYTFADPGGFFQKLPLLFRSGSAPDVFMAAESWVSGLSSLGGYADLSSDMRRDGLSESTWLPGAINAGKVGKKILALPVVVYPKGIAYNETLFRKNHVPTPTASWTQADFLRAARAVQAGSGSQGRWGVRRRATFRSGATSSTRRSSPSCRPSAPSSRRRWSASGSLGSAVAGGTSGSASCWPR
jgi:multiple sugar transport system substrate-binding protein